MTLQPEERVSQTLFVETSRIPTEQWRPLLVNSGVSGTKSINQGGSVDNTCTKQRILNFVKRAGQKVAGLGMLAWRKTLTGALRCVRMCERLRSAMSHGTGSMTHGHAEDGLRGVLSRWVRLRCPGSFGGRFRSLLFVTKCFSPLRGVTRTSDSSGAVLETQFNTVALQQQ